MSGLIDEATFLALAGHVCDPSAAQCTHLYLAGEASDFIRFNRGLVSQATRVEQCYATLTVSEGARQIQSRLTLTGRTEVDVPALRAERSRLVAALAEVPDDPYLLLPETPSSTRRHDLGALPTAEQVIAAVRREAKGLDFVGFYAGGPVVRAFADSLGQRHWHHVESFQFSWCLYLAADKAIKSSLAGGAWSDEAFAAKVREGAERLSLLSLPPRELAPGAYRAWFSPPAMAELLNNLAWGGFGLKARRTGTSTLGWLEEGRARLSAAMTLDEDTEGGVAPCFTAEGFVKPRAVPLVTQGKWAGCLTSPRSAREYAVPTNGANGDETPQSLRLAAGTIREGDALTALDTGLLVSNLWYLNYSDRQACRMTGMTRFACFWVEGGRVVAPLPVMRFDDSFLRLFGEGLVGLSDQAELVPDDASYGERRLASVTTPAALVEGWRLTL